MAGARTVLGPIRPLRLLAETWAWLAAPCFWDQQRKLQALHPHPFSFIIKRLFTLPEEINVQAQRKPARIPETTLK